MHNLHYFAQKFDKYPFEDDREGNERKSGLFRLKPNWSNIDKIFQRHGSFGHTDSSDCRTGFIWTFQDNFSVDISYDYQCLAAHTSRCLPNLVYPRNSENIGHYD